MPSDSQKSRTQPAKSVELSDCCLEVYISDSYPKFVFKAGEMDIFTKEEVIWPTPVIYWDNGVKTAGGISDQEADALLRAGRLHAANKLAEAQHQAAVYQARLRAGMD